MSESAESLAMLRENIVERVKELLEEVHAPSPPFDLSFEEENMPSMVSTMTKLRKYLLAAVQSNTGSSAIRTPERGKSPPSSLQQNSVSSGGHVQTPPKSSAKYTTSPSSPSLAHRIASVTPSKRRKDIPPNTIGESGQTRTRTNQNSFIESTCCFVLHSCETTCQCSLTHDSAALLLCVMQPEAML